MHEGLNPEEAGDFKIEHSAAELLGEIELIKDPKSTRDVLFNNWVISTNNKEPDQAEEWRVRLEEYDNDQKAA